MKLDAKPPFDIVFTNADGSRCEPRARSKDQRECKGCWMLPVRMQTDGTYRLFDEWQTRAIQAEPVQQGHWWECLVQDAWSTLGAQSGDAGARVVVLMLWPHRNSAYVSPTEKSTALDAAAPAAGVAVVLPATRPAPDEVAAIEAAFVAQGLSTGVIGRP